LATTEPSSVRPTSYSQALPVLLMRAREAVAERFRPVFRAHGMTEQQWRVLRALSDGAEVEVMALTRLVFLHGPSLSRILKTMTERGLVSRRAADADRRVSLISITKAGRDLIRETAPEALKAGQEVSRLFGQTRMDQLQELLLALETILNEANQGLDERAEPCRAAGRS
jgi:homoprotocatechuate degradation regulator HpaR